MLTRHGKSWVGIALFSALVASRGLGQSFELSWHSVDGGGAMFSSGGDFELSGTIGQPDAGPSAGPMTGGSFSLVGGFWPGASAGGPPQPGDCDADGDVDLSDYADLAACLDGPLGGIGGGCECFDIDADGEVTLADFAEFQAVFTE